MKKLIITFSLVFVALSTFTSQAQFRLGVKAGANISHVSFDRDIFSTDNLGNFTGGVMAEFTVPIIGLGLDASVMYAGKGYKSYSTLTDNSGNPAGNIDEKVRMHYIDIPVNLKWKFGLPMAKIFLTAGPGFNFLLNKNFKTETKGESIPDTYLDRALKDKKFDLSINVGGGVELFSHLQVAVQYGWGLTNSLKSYSTGKGKNRNLQITAAYLF